MKSILDDLPKKIYDDKAFTIAELSKEAGLGISQMGIFARAKVQNGEWEQVWKRVNNYPARAYRKKK